MTINLADNNPRVAYSVAQGVTQTSFSVPFEFFEDADVNVYVNGTLKTQGSDYTLSGGDGSTGTVTMSVTGATGGSTVILFRRIAIERTSDFQVGVDISRPALNEQLDVLTAIAADHDDRLDRSLHVADSDSTTPDLSLDNFSSFYGKTLVFNASTGKPEAGPTVAEVAGAEASAIAAAASASAASASETAAGASETAAAASAAAAAASAESVDANLLLSKAGNLSGLANTATARQNLGVEIGVDVQAYDATILVDADIGVNVQAYDATILNAADIGSSVQAYDATLLNAADIGVTVQAYDADTAKLDVAQSFTAAQRGSTDTDATNTGNVTLDFATNQNFVLTLTGNVTLDNPTTEVVGQSGFIVFIQDATGGRTLSLGTDYETAGGAGITLSSAANATDVVPYIVAASGRILLGAPQLAFA